MSSIELTERQKTTFQELVDLYRESESAVKGKALDGNVRTIRAIEGSSLDPVDIPEGCSYHPRCPLATSKCYETDPDYHDVETGHEATCFREYSDDHGYWNSKPLSDDEDNVVPQTADE